MTEHVRVWGKWICILLLHYRVHWRLVFGDGGGGCGVCVCMSETGQPRVLFLGGCPPWILRQALSLPWISSSRLGWLE